MGKAVEKLTSMFEIFILSGVLGHTAATMSITLQIKVLTAPAGFAIAPRTIEKIVLSAFQKLFKKLRREFQMLEIQPKTPEPLLPPLLEGTGAFGDEDGDGDGELPGDGDVLGEGEGVLPLLGSLGNGSLLLGKPSPSASLLVESFG